MSDIPLRRLDDLAHIIMGQSPDADRISADGGGLPFLQGCAEFGAKHPAAVATCSPPLRVAPEGSVLISVRAPVGTMNVADQAYCIGRGLGAFKAKDGLADTNFLKHAAALAAPWLHRRSQGSTFAAISADDLRRLPVPDSSPPTQRRIAAILTALDTAIEATEALIEKHEQIKAGLMHDLFTRGIGSEGQLREQSASVVTNSGHLPSRWRLGSILELTDPDRQPILTGPFGADLGSDDFVDEGVPVLRIGNVQAGWLNLADLLFVSPRKASLLSRYRVKEGDLLFARQGATTGRNALADSRVDGSLINYHIIRVALDHRRCAPLFVEAAFASDLVKRQIERDKGRGTREGINTAQITSLAFPIASLSEQRQIANVLAAQNACINADLEVLQCLQMQKQGLMQDLLTGKVRVPTPSKEATA